MIAAAKERFPECLPWVLTCYGSPSFLKFGPYDISSQCGLQQGDPLASLLFCLALKPVVDAIAMEVPGLALNAWFLDDGHLVGTLEEIKCVVDLILREGRPRGLILSTAATVSAPSEPKTKLWSPLSGVGDQDQDPLNRGIPKVRAGSGIIVLGAPVGYDAFAREVLHDRIEKVRQVTELLPLLQDPHCEFMLLRSCLALPKVMFLLRALDTSRFGDLLEEFDATTRGALSKILGTPVQDLHWEQAKLPAAMGGLGLRSAFDHGPIAYATSIISAQPLIKDLLGKDEAEDPISLPESLLDSISARQGEPVDTESLVGVTQKMASLKVDLRNQSLLLNHFTTEGVTREIARMASLGLPHASDWLSACPSPALGLHLRGPEFICALKYRLGVPLYGSEGECPACSLPCDRMGDHALSCAQYGERIARHNVLRDMIFETAASAALAPVREGRHLLPGQGAKPADILLPRWSDGRDAALDVTVTSSLATSHVAGAATAAGSALDKAYDRKVQGAAEACRQQGLAFFPLAWEALGGMHRVAIRQTKMLATALARHTGQEEGEASKHLFQRLSLGLMRGNAALLVSRGPDGDHPAGEIDGRE